MQYEGTILLLVCVFAVCFLLLVVGRSTAGDQRAFELRLGEFGWRDLKARDFLLRMPAIAFLVLAVLLLVLAIILAG